MASYFTRLWDAIVGRTLGSEQIRAPVEQPASAPQLAPPDPSLELHARLASLELELRERDEQIATMRHEYAVLQASKERASAGAGEEHFERLFKRLVGPLSSLTALAAMCESGGDVAAEDLVQLIRGVEKELARAGLEPIGAVGHSAPFDVARHQRMSGGDVRAGTDVAVQIPGYRFGDKILLKALVTAAPDQVQPEQGQAGQIRNDRPGNEPLQDEQEPPHG